MPPVKRTVLLVGIRTKAIAIYAIRGVRVLSSNLIVLGSEESSTCFMDEFANCRYSVYSRYPLLLFARVCFPRAHELKQPGYIIALWNIDFPSNAISSIACG